MIAAPGHRLRPGVAAAMRADRGEVTVELVVATPLLLLMLLGIVQFALWSHATHLAQAAAAQALSAARTDTGTAAAGHEAGQDVLKTLGDGPLHEGDLTVSRGPEAVTVRVHGVVSPVVPGVHLPVHAEATGPIERFVPDTP